MPFMVVSEDDFQKELNKLDSPNIEPLSSLDVHEIETGRGAGNIAVPESIRELVAEESLQGTPAKTLERVFGISPSSISAYKNGATSTASYHKPTDKLTQVRNRVSSRAANRLNDALKALANKDLAGEKAKDISSIAKDMATVFDKISPVRQIEKEADKTMHIHLYAPPLKSVDDYEVIDQVESAK